ncbi:MAG: hypothetical protein R6V15_01100 [Desulfotignum sp.]
MNSDTTIYFSRVAICVYFIFPCPVLYGYAKTISMVWEKGNDGKQTEYQTAFRNAADTQLLLSKQGQVFTCNIFK